MSDKILVILYRSCFLHKYDCVDVILRVVMESGRGLLS